MMLPWSIAWLCIALYGCGYAQSEPTWQTLRVTRRMSFQAFTRMPMTVSEAENKGFWKLAGGCDDGQFLGHRYMKGLDTSAVLLFDVNGYIAGMQYGIPKHEVLIAKPIYSFENSSAFQLDKILGEEEVYFLTAYFVEPGIICRGGRTSEEYLQERPGTGLFLQNGTDPLLDSINVPLYEKDLEGTDWVKGGCVWTVGVHYWYDMKEDSPCSDMFPFSPTYNRGKLTNFAFIAPGLYEFSGRFEHPTASALTKYLPTPAPECVFDEYDASGGYSIMHVYFTVRPWNMKC